MHIRARALATIGALVAVLFFAASADLFAQDKKDEKKKPKYSKEQVQEMQSMIALVDDVASGKQPAPSDIPTTFQNHFMRSREGKAFMPFTIAMDAAGVTQPSIVLYLRAVKKGEAAPAAPVAKEGKDKGKPMVEYAWEDLEFVDLKAPAPGQPYRLSRYMGLLPGEYDVYVGVRERSPGEKKDKKAAPGKSTVLKQSITAIDYNSALVLSSIIVVDKVEDLQAPIPEAQLKENPYTFGLMKLTPALVNKFTKAGEMSWIFVIYNATLDATAGKPDLTVEYSFYQKTKEGEKYFNKTSPQAFNAQTLPPQWDGKLMNQISAGQSVPLASFPEGEFRLEVKVQDKLANKTLTENVTFTVVAGS